MIDSHLTKDLLEQSLLDKRSTNKIGAVIKRKAFAFKAPKKSNSIRHINKCVMPQPGHFNPVMV